MSMTKKDYELVARVLAIFNASENYYMKEVASGISRSLCIALEVDNPEFNPKRFLAACGVESL